MKRIVLVVSLVIGSLVATRTFANDTDTLQQLKEKMEKMEKQVQALQTELKALKSNDSSLSAQMKDVKKPAPATKSRTLVIDRRGSKQAYMQ